MIPPRGCAYVCMKERQEADRALHKIKYCRLNGKVSSTISLSKCLYVASGELAFKCIFCGILLSKYIFTYIIQKQKDIELFKAAEKPIETFDLLKV